MAKRTPEDDVPSDRWQKWSAEDAARPDLTATAPRHEPPLVVPQARIRVAAGPDVGREVVVGDRRVTVGRAQGNDLVLSDRTVSAIHLEVRSSAGGLRLRDLGSTNGTFLGTHRIGEVTLGADGAVRVGDTMLAIGTLAGVVAVPSSAEERFGSIIGAARAMRQLFALLEQIAPSDLTVLLEGETGTGKEEVARSIHQKSPRAAGPFVVLDCSAMPQGLAEGLVLGYEKGAFTGADHRHVGAFESAHGGTIFLDEIGEMSPALQPKLLRVLESREVARLGDNRPRRVDVRVVAATNRDLRRMVNDGSFRADLYYRLAEAHVTVPPLRERLGDVRMLVDHFALRASVRSGRRPRTFSAPALARLERHGWPGNVRELRNLIERLAALAPEDEVDEDVVARELRVEKVHRSIPVYPEAPYKEARAEALKRFDSIYLTELHELSGGNLSKAARQAGLARHYLRWLFRKAGVQYRD